MQPQIVSAPTTARPLPPVATQQNPGAIFQTTSSRMLFEERVARYVGDTLTIQIEENLSASNSSTSSANRDGSAKVGGSGDLPYFPGALSKFFDANASMSSGNTFAGKGATNNSNTLRGILAVTVIEVLPNGNLIVGGEKQIAVNGYQNAWRFTGVVNPFDIKAGNIVSSTRVADARIEQVGQGAIADANTVGWLQRLFLNVMPF
ncbi:flagellar basal body L-ring protein FlgH [Jeongeupia sp. USM3]|uniref:flagellar basal body L-ring protein FlgH n=1 Tax=Jeongeupia sp. USM3 TaxID=1906741 RepID=UPI001F24274E|nr:flagellar basal body L-ring protein FlgH [Jeongeupia sp. USM3]